MGAPKRGLAKPGEPVTAEQRVCHEHLVLTGRAAYDPDMDGALRERLLTVEDLYELPDDGRRYELEAGRLLAEPPPGARHGLVTAVVVRLLGDFARAQGLGVVFTADAGFILARSPDTLRGPDAAFVSKTRFDKVGAVPTAFPGPPDLVVEVLSPSDRAAEVRAKVADYLAAGTSVVWVVDPESQCVTVYRSLLAPRVLAVGDELAGEDILPGFTVRVAELFEF